jgi:Common central domain of tyrosinase
MSGKLAATRQSVRVRNIHADSHLRRPASSEGAAVALGDGIRRNIASVEPAERALLRDAFLKMNAPKWDGTRNDTVPGGVTWWFKQDEIHKVTHVHHGVEFLPWHREVVNRCEDQLRVIDPRLSLHYWDWTQDPRSIPNANLGNGLAGTLSLFTQEFMGHGGTDLKPIGPPWDTAGFYDPHANPFRSDNSFDPNNNPADKPQAVNRQVNGSPVSQNRDDGVVAAQDYADMTALLEESHDKMHGFVNMGNRHISFRDPFVFLLHSNVDRLFALWQTQPSHPGRLLPDHVYGTAAGDPELNGNIEPWSSGHTVNEVTGQEHFIRPWCEPERLGIPKTYKDLSIVTPRRYDTSLPVLP